MTTQTVTDRVIATDRNDHGEVGLRMADWTPTGGYTALVEAADDAGIDLTDPDPGDTVGLARIEYETDTGDEYGRATRIVNVEFLDADAEEFYADVTVCFEGQIRLPVIAEAPHLEPSDDQWADEVREVFAEGVADVYFDLQDPHVEIDEVFRD